MWEGQPAVWIDALSRVAMVRMQASINVTMGTCLMAMVVHHCAMLSQDFNVWEVQVFPKIFALKYVEMGKILN